MWALKEYNLSLPYVWLRFHSACDKLLSVEEKSYLLRALGDYSSLHKIDRLILAVRSVFDSPEKQKLVEVGSINHLTIHRLHRTFASGFHPAKPTNQHCPRSSEHAALH